MACRGYSALHGVNLDQKKEVVYLYYTMLNEWKYTVKLKQWIDNISFLKTKAIYGKNKNKWLNMSMHYAQNFNVHVRYRNFIILLLVLSYQLEQ